VGADAAAVGLVDGVATIGEALATLAAAAGVGAGERQVPPVVGEPEEDAEPELPLTLEAVDRIIAERVAAGFDAALPTRAQAEQQTARDLLRHEAVLAALPESAQRGAFAMAVDALQQGDRDGYQAALDLVGHNAAHAAGILRPRARR
jgi:ClpP class serine protease